MVRGCGCGGGVEFCGRCLRHLDLRQCFSFLGTDGVKVLLPYSQYELCHCHCAFFFFLRYSLHIILEGGCITSANALIKVCLHGTPLLL